LCNAIVDVFSKTFERHEFILLFVNVFDGTINVHFTVILIKCVITTMFTQLVTIYINAMLLVNSSASNETTQASLPLTTLFPMQVVIACNGGQKNLSENSRIIQAPYLK